MIKENLIKAFLFNFIFNQAENHKQISNSIENNLLEEKFKETRLCFNFINLLFSKFSSEIIFRKENDGFKKCKIQPVKAIKDTNIQSNKRINFKAFLKLLICISNKIFNPEFAIMSNNKESNIDSHIFTNISKKQSEEFINIEKLLDTKMADMQNYFENFILNYLSPIYCEIQNFFEKEALDIMIFERINEDSNAENFLFRIKPVFQGIYKFYTDGNEFMYFENFYK